MSTWSTHNFYGLGLEKNNLNQYKIKEETTFAGFIKKEVASSRTNDNINYSDKKTNFLLNNILKTFKKNFELKI